MGETMRPTWKIVRLAFAGYLAEIVAVGVPSSRICAHVAADLTCHRGARYVTFVDNGAR
jgi:hypothetical protein